MGILVKRGVTAHFNDDVRCAGATHIAATLLASENHHDHHRDRLHTVLRLVRFDSIFEPLPCFIDSEF